MLSAILGIAIALPQTETKTYMVEGTERRAAIYAPTKPTSRPPLVFGFHGHGGNMRNAARSFRMHEEWPEAVVVYMQGLPTRTGRDPMGERPGWQITALGGSDRDLKFFDAVYADVAKRFSVDGKRVFAMGHSNGGRFTYLLWAERGDKFRAFAPSGSPATGLSLTPKPVFHILGEQDAIVDPVRQKETVAAIRAKNGCSESGTKFGVHSTRYPGKDGNDVVAFFHPGGHEYPREAPSQIVSFFQSLP